MIGHNECSCVDIFIIKFMFHCDLIEPKNYIES